LPLHRLIGCTMELAFESIGDGPPVVLLHGLFGSAASWRGVARELADAYSVCSVDLRNHGRSPRAADMSYTAMADDVLRLIEDEGLQRPALVGHSMGGKVAMALALTAPQALRSVTVIDIAPVAYADRWSPQLNAMNELIGRSVAMSRDDGRLSADEAPTIAMMVPHMATRNAYVDWRSNLPAISLSIHELCGFPRQLRYLSTELPLHAIVGGQSDLVNPVAPETFAPMFPRASVEVIPEAGHWVHVDQPGALVRSLRRALARVTPVTS
jgi:pimeloyl-ACP methyl ester carboxylesterase